MTHRGGEWVVAWEFDLEDPSWFERLVPVTVRGGASEQLLQLGAGLHGQGSPLVGRGVGLRIVELADYVRVCSAVREGNRLTLVAKGRGRVKNTRTAGVQITWKYVKRCKR